MIKTQVHKSYNIEYPPFSVSMCVYRGDHAEWFGKALGSVINQTVKPQEIVLVVDGPIPDLIEAVIDKYRDICRKGNITFRILRFERNEGHGKARRLGLEYCQNEMVALMDSDDISVPDRFEQQCEFFRTNAVDIVGGNIAEFMVEVNNTVAFRNVPERDEEIKKYMKTRCPFNQMTVMFRKKCVMEAGGYLDWYCDEDYYLWIRMALAGCTMANTGTVLCRVRVGEDLYQRRGGIKYFQSEARLQNYMLKHKVISIKIYAFNIIKRFIVQVLLPNRLRGWVFQKFARE